MSRATPHCLWWCAAGKRCGNKGTLRAGPSCLRTHNGNRHCKIATEPVRMYRPRAISLAGKRMSTSCAVLCAPARKMDYPQGRWSAPGRFPVALWNFSGWPRGRRRAPPAATPDAMSRDPNGVGVRERNSNSNTLPIGKVPVGGWKLDPTNTMWLPFAVPH